MTKIFEALKELNTYEYEFDEWSLSTNGSWFYLNEGNTHTYAAHDNEDEIVAEINRLIGWKRHPATERELKIVEVNDEHILFDNGYEIVYDHEQDCCEDNYADFKQIEDIAFDYTFKGKLRFEKVEQAGFRFGDSRRMFFIPCYSDQNGYYTTEVEIYLKSWNREKMMTWLNAPYGDDY